MNDDLIALAGDLVFERKRLSESLRRLEARILQSEFAQELFRRIGVGGAEAIHADLDLIAKSLDRVGALTKTLVHTVNQDRLRSCKPMLESASSIVQALGNKLGRPVVVEVTQDEIQIEQETIVAFQPVFHEMLSSLVEFCIESPRERQMRQKRAKAYFKLEVKPVEDGYRLTVFCDGNGLAPPLVQEQGLKLARIGVRATFEGKPGAWGAWFFHLPTGVGTFRCVPVRAGSHRLCIPSWAVRDIMPVSNTPANGLSAKSSIIWGLGESISRFKIDSGYEGGYGKSVVTVAAGTTSERFVFETTGDAQEAFMKPLHEMFTGNGRFLGVVLDDSPNVGVAEASSSNESDRVQKLCLVLNPAYLVYGDAALSAPSPEAKEVNHAL
jgi:hypothetical protein